MKWRHALFISVLAVSFPAAAPLQSEDIRSPGLSLLWRFATGGQIRSRPAVAPDGTIYAASEDGLLYALDSGGMLQWKCNLGWLPWDCLALGGDGTIYAGLKNADIVAINPNGRLLWRFHLDGLPAGDPAVAADGTLYVGTAAGTLVALSHLGRPQWTVTLPGAITHAPAVDGAGTVYVVAADRRLYALTQWGDFKWSLPLAARPGTLAIAAGARVLVGTDSGDVIAVNPSGDIAWRYSAGARIAGVSAGPGRICAATSSGLIIGLSDKGTPLWKNVTGKRIEAAPLTGRSLYAYATDGTLLLIDPARPGTGSFALGTYGSAVLGNTGILYLGGRDWIVYAVGEPQFPGTSAGGSVSSGAPRPSSTVHAGARPPGAWPQEGHDEAHSGRTDEGPPGGNEELLNSVPDFLYLRSLAEVDSRDIIMLLLAKIRERIDTHTIGKSTWYVVRLLEQFSGEGLLNPVYRNMRVINNFPDVRAEAALLLGMVGSTSSRHVLIQVIGSEDDVFALSAQIGALGSLASDSDGSSSRAIASAFSRAGMSPPDERIAAATLDALDRIGAYVGGVGEPAAAAALSSIYRGDFSQQIRSRALTVLRKDRM